MFGMINEIYTCVTSTFVWARSDDAALKVPAFDKRPITMNNYLLACWFMGGAQIFTSFIVLSLVNASKGVS